MYSLDVGALGTFLANVKSGWTVVANQSASDKSGIKNSDLQVGKATGSSPSFSMAHKMGLAILDMTTGKEVPIKRTYTFDNANGTGTISDSSGKTTIKPYHGFNTTTSSNYCVPLYATTVNSDCYYVVKANGDNTNSSTKFGCNVTNTTEYWSDVTVSSIGYGKCSTIAINSARPAAGMVANFSYVGTGAKQTFTVPWYGSYTIECWGANGGASPTSGSSYALPGIGGYTKGNISLIKSKELYVYVGGVGNNNVKTLGGSNSGGWNGGGYTAKNGAGPEGYEASSGGGGSTDVRLSAHTSGTWGYNSSTNTGDASLKTRIMVAGGGGGCGYIIHHSNNSEIGGCGGGLTGEPGTAYGSTVSDNYNTANTVALGGTQTECPTPTSWYDEGYNRFGDFGYANQTYNTQDSYGAGAGGGWYGGLKGIGNGGGGGSSFISGHPGCVSHPDKRGSANNIAKIDDVEYTFSSTQMIDGDGYLWDSATEARVYQSAMVPGLPKKGSTTASKPGVPTKAVSGNNGCARITSL